MSSVRKKLTNLLYPSWREDSPDNTSRCRQSN